MVFCSTDIANILESGMRILYLPKSSQTSTIISANTHAEFHQKYVSPTSHDHLNQQKYDQKLNTYKTAGPSSFLRSQYDHLRF